MKVGKAETDGSGNGTFSIRGLKLPTGKFLTATATSITTMDTSPFSVCVST
ncbi:MAG: hypothetical protein ABSB24_13525 [Gaiellaceae bacterium]|jgi:hypothetical protein